MNYTDEYGVEYSEDRKVLLKFSKDRSFYEVPDGTEKLGAQAFKDCEKLTGLSLPASLTKVEGSAFLGCKHVQEIVFRGTLSEYLRIEWLASIECGHIVSVNGEPVKNLVVPNDVDAISAYAFYYCKSIETLKLHPGVKKIGDDAFNKSALSGDIILPEGFTTIGAYAFFNSQIKSVSIPSSIERIGKGAFSACYSFHSFSLVENEKFKVDGGRAIIQKANLTPEFKKKSILQRVKEGLDDVDENTIIAFAGTGYKEPYVIPSDVSTFAAETFCYSTLGSAGIWIKHEMSYIPADAFRKAEGKVYVLPKLKPYYFKEIPSEILIEKYDQDFAFKTDVHRMSVVAENPFRVLGVYANASQKEITANARKIKRYLEVGKNIEFPTDFSKFLSPIVRTEEMVDKALADISASDGKWKNALFWFVNVDDIDEIALGHLQANNIDKAKEIWSKRITWNSKLNLSTLYLLYPNIDDAYSEIYELYYGTRPEVKDSWKDRYNIDTEIHYEDFLRSILSEEDVEGIDNYEIESSYIDGLIKDVDLVDLRAMCLCNNFALNYRLRKVYFDQINDAIQAAKNVSSKDNQGSYMAMSRLLEISQVLEEYIAHFGTGDDKYKLIADNLANTLLQSAINYYNSAEDDYDENGSIIAEQAAHAAEAAMEIATSQLRKDRCKQNIEILRKNADRLPPKEIINDEEKIEELLEKHVDTPETIEQAYSMLKDSVQYLCHIKEQIEKCRLSTKRAKLTAILEHLSTKVIAVALNKLIKEVNDATKSNNNAVDTIRKAWEVMHSMDNFPMVADFKKERYNANRQTLGNLYDKTLPLGHLGFGISSLGITPKTYSILSLKTDEEYWKACKSIADYQHYLELYKPAAHAEEAQEKIRRFTEDADNIAWAGAKEKDDVQSYRNYLKRYPQGIHANEARKKLAEIGEMLFGQCKSLADYKEYARLFPDGEHITDVAVRISALEKSQKKDSIEKGICIWLLVAFAFTIALTVLSMFVANQVLVGWITGSVFAYIISLVIYVGIKSQEPQEKQKLTSQNYRSDDFALWYGIIAFLIIEIPTFLICYAIWHKDDEGTWIIASLGVSVTLWVMRFYVLLYLWIKELLGDLHLKIIKNREKAK